MWFQANSRNVLAAMTMIVAGVTSPCFAQLSGNNVLHVPGDYPTIQAAIDVAVDGDEILVAPGSYYENLHLIGYAITLHSSGGPDVTIIDAQGSDRVVRCNSGEGADTVLEGFTITGGSHSLGGGMRNYYSSPTVRNCIFLANTAVLGGGVDNYFANPTFENCTFIGNTASESGGGVENHHARAEFFNCTFTDNWAGLYGGGAVFSETSEPLFIDCLFNENSSTAPGGALNFIYGSPVVINCRFIENQAKRGGGMAQSYADPLFVNCLFLGNTGNQTAGAISTHESGLHLVNCTLAQNSSPDIGGILMHGQSSDVNLINCILWGNTDDGGQDQHAQIDFIWGEPENIHIDYSCVQGWTGEYGGTGNIGDDPLFADPGNGDFYLGFGSPCIDAGLNNILPADVYDLDDDGLTCDRVPIDLDDNPRFADDEATADTGCGVPVVVDMGVFEYAGISEDVVYADVDGDGKVDIVDVFSVLADWGVCDGCCLGDLNVDGVVDIDDIFEVLNNWGLCSEVPHWGMAFIPGGEFEMGRHVGEGEPDEWPVHDVYVDSFYMSVYETTNEEYCAYLNSAWDQGLIEVIDGVVYKTGDSEPYCDTFSASSYSRIHWNGSTFTVASDKENHPMLELSWYGAVAYTNWRSAQEGLTSSYDLETWECDWDANGYRLPTEAEWEYAARGGEHDPYYAYPWGDDIDGSKANYNGSGDPYEGPVPETTSVGYYDGGQTPPGEDMANGYRLYDMAGNVYEWCHDWYYGQYYVYSPYDNPHGPESGTLRVVRGGSSAESVTSLRCAYRNRTGPGSRSINYGFRLALD